MQMIVQQVDRESVQRYRILQLLLQMETCGIQAMSPAQIQKELGAASLQMIRSHIAKLRGAGMVATGKPRTLGLTDQGRQFARSSA